MILSSDQPRGNSVTPRKPTPGLCPPPDVPLALASPSRIWRRVEGEVRSTKSSSPTSCEARSNNRNVPPVLPFSPSAPDYQGRWTLLGLRIFPSCPTTVQWDRQTKEDSPRRTRKALSGTDIARAPRTCSTSTRSMGRTASPGGSTN